MKGLMACGLPLEEVVPIVTLNAARILGREDQLGALRPGAVPTSRCSTTGAAASASVTTEGEVSPAAAHGRRSASARGAGVEADASILPRAEAA